MSAAESSFLDGDQYAYLAGLVAVLIGAGLTWVVFPKKDEEEKLRSRFHAQDEGESTAPPGLPHPASATGSTA